MNATCHRPIYLEIFPTDLLPVSNGSLLYTLRMGYREYGNPQVFLGTHVPKKLLPILERGNVAMLHLETLEVNSLAQRRLPGRPDYLVLGVRTFDGSEFLEVPVELRQARLNIGLLGTAACLVGAGFVFSPYAWAGAFLVVVGSHLVRSARNIPSRPFVVYGEQC